LNRWARLSSVIVIVCRRWCGLRGLGAVSSWASGYLVYSVNAAHASFAVDPVPDNDSGSDVSATELPLFCDAFENGTNVGWSSVIS